jgi:hypothetical protein
MCVGLGQRSVGRNIQLEGEAAGKDEAKHGEVLLENQAVFDIMLVSGSFVRAVGISRVRVMLLLLQSGHFVHGGPMSGFQAN